MATEAKRDRFFDVGSESHHLTAAFVLSSDRPATNDLLQKLSDETRASLGEIVARSLDLAIRLIEKDPATDPATREFQRIQAAQSVS